MIKRISLALFALVLFCENPMAAPLAEYLFNGNANDSSGNNRHGIVHGAKLSIDRHGNQNSAYLFDGEDDYIQLPHIFHTSTEGYFAITFWVCVSNTQEWAYLPPVFSSVIGEEAQGLPEPEGIQVGIWPMKRNPTGPPLIPYGMTFPLPVSDRIFTTFQGHHYSFENEIPLEREIKVDQWHHIAFVIESAWHYRLFMDGHLVTYRNIRNPGDWGDAGFTAGGNPTIGRGRQVQGALSPYVPLVYFKGKIDDLIIHDHPLTELEVRKLYNEDTRPTPKPKLYNRGAGLIYDEAQDITWLNVPAAQPLKHWHHAMEFAINYVHHDHLRDKYWDDWRLPTAYPVDGRYWVPCWRATGNNIEFWGGVLDAGGYNQTAPGTASAGVVGRNEMAHLFYNSLGNTGRYRLDGTVVPDSEIVINTGPFKDLLVYNALGEPTVFWTSRYWTVVDECGGLMPRQAAGGTVGSTFTFWEGRSSYSNGGDGNQVRTLLVRDGDVGPIPPNKSLLFPIKSKNGEIIIIPME